MIIHSKAECHSVIWLSLLFHSVFPQPSQFQSCDSQEKTCLTKSPTYEARAVLVPCHPHQHHHRCPCGQLSGTHVSGSNACDQGKLTDCTKKVVISVKIANVGATNCKQQYVVVDEVYDCQTDTKHKLLYPYVLKLKQEPLLQTYRLDCESSIKERCRAIERVKYVRSRGTRGIKAPWIQKIPLMENPEHFSHAIQKVKRRTPMDTKSEEYSRKLKAKSNPYFPGGYLKGCHERKPSFNKRPNPYVDYAERFNNILGRPKETICPLKNKGEFGIFHSRDKNNARFGVEEKRSGLSSRDVPMKPPPNEGCDSLSSHSSARYPALVMPQSCCYENCALCNMRYYIYKLQEPIIKHHFSVEIFEKHYDITGAVQWNIITEDRPILLGTYDTEYRARNGAFAISYHSREPPLRNFALAYEKVRLLIPQFPHLRGGPERFLLIPENMFTRTQECFDTSGVHYGSHENYVIKSSTLKYPPKWFWCQDRKREPLGYRGNFFLKYFANLPPTPLHNTTDCFQNISLFYEGPHHSFINIEIKADYNTMLKPHSSAAITEVYVDATHFEKTDITVKVTNTGLVYAAFYVFLTDCPLRLPAGFSNIATSSAVIPPQKQHVFAITVLYPLPKRKFYCSVDVKNYRHDVLAFRRIRFQKSDRCICIWHCCCTCLEADKGLKCHSLPIDHYNAAGFSGGLPIASNYVISTSFVEEYLILMFNLCLTMTILLLFLGICKAVFGLCFPPIGRFGLEWYLGLPKSIDKYYESNLRMRPVQYDKLGWPVHPETRKRCRTTSLSTEFTINVVFFLLYPLVLLHAIVVKVFTPEYVNDKVDRRVEDRRCRFENYGRTPSSVISSPLKSCLKRYD